MTTYKPPQDEVIISLRGENSNFSIYKPDLSKK